MDDAVLDVQVGLDTSFNDLFRDTRGKALSSGKCRARWATWLRACRAVDGYCARYWQSAEGCCEPTRCDHLKGKAWCSLQGLPCSVNPVLTFGGAGIGMACMGGGHTAEQVMEGSVAF